MSEADSEVTAAEAAQQGPDRTASRGLLLAAVGVVWMAGTLWSARATISGRVEAEMEVTNTAYALPGAVSAGLVAGAAVALAVIAYLTRGDRTVGTTTRFIIATGAGLAVGALGALTMLTINTEGWIYQVLGGTIAAAATIGGAMGGLRQPRVVAAVCWGAVTVFVVGVVLSFLTDDLLPVFGAGSSAGSQTSAVGWFSFTQSVVSGVAGALVAYKILRRSHGPELRWPFYALAGGGPGLFLLVSEGLTRTAGARLVELAGKVSELEQVVQQILAQARLESALIVMFVGAFTAMILVGRTLGKPAPAEPAPSEPTTPARPAP